MPAYAWRARTPARESKQTGEDGADSTVMPGIAGNVIQQSGDAMTRWSARVALSGNLDAGSEHTLEDSTSSISRYGVRGLAHQVGMVAKQPGGAGVTLQRCSSRSSSAPSEDARQWLVSEDLASVACVRSIYV